MASIIYPYGNIDGGATHSTCRKRIYRLVYYYHDIALNKPILPSQQYPVRPIRWDFERVDFRALIHATMRFRFRQLAILFACALLSGAPRKIS